MKSNQTYLYLTVGLILLALVGVYMYNLKKGSSPSKGGAMEESSGKPIDQSHRSYEMKVTSSIDKLKPNAPVTLTYTINNDKGEILKQFEIAHEKIMHFIVVRKDLQGFQHLHPTFNQSTGEFSVEMTFPSDGLYRIFPDFTPGADNPQKLPVTVYSDVTVGDQTRYKAQQAATDTQTKKMIGEYQVTFTVPKIKAQEEFSYSLDVSKNGQPVTDLEKYLGALGHSVVIKEGSLDFIHAHAGEAGTNQDMHHGGTVTGNTENTGPKIEFTTNFSEAGVYKIFTQFQHNGKVQTIDYVVNAN